MSKLECNITCTPYNYYTYITRTNVPYKDVSTVPPHISKWVCRCYGEGGSGSRNHNCQALCKLVDAAVMTVSLTSTGLVLIAILSSVSIGWCYKTFAVGCIL